jgi:hypothetical protein
VSTHPAVRFRLQDILNRMGADYTVEGEDARLLIYDSGPVLEASEL